MGYEDVEWDEIIEGGSLPDEALRNKHLEDNEGRKAGSNRSSCLQEEMGILGNRPGNVDCEPGQYCRVGC